MSEELNQESVDAAIILENKIKERVQEIVVYEINKTVVNIIGKVFKQQQEAMMMEIAIKLGQIMRTTEKEHRRPLWDSKPEDFGLKHEDLNRSSIRRLDDVQQEINNAIHKVP